MLQDNTGIKVVEQAEYNERFPHVKEIYNEEMSPTSVELGVDQHLGIMVAIKHIYKDQLMNDIQRNQAKLECTLHPQLLHDNIVRCHDVFQNDKTYTIVLEYMNQANHFVEKIDEQLRFINREEKMKSYMTDILEGISYIHSQGYIHCDLKLENLFCVKEEDDIHRDVKVGDMGLIHTYDKETGKGFMEVKCGTTSYIAPEVANNSVITPKIDIWSLGIVLYKMCCGYKPTQIQGFKYGQGPIPFRKFDWKKRSPELQEIITMMLDMDPANRPDCETLLQHKWFDA